MGYVRAGRAATRGERYDVVILVVDTETTGTDPATAEVIELAGVLIDGHEGFWQGLIKPKGTIPPETSAIHHLTSKDFVASGYDDLGAAWRDMYAWAGRPAAFAAHNAQFDRGFIARGGWGVSAPWLCTWRCARHLFPDAPGFGNQVLRYYLELDPYMPQGLAPHRALYDTIVTAALLKKMLIIKPLDELLVLQYQPVLLKTVSFGKHRGALWSDVPRSYLQWVCTQDFDEDVVYTAHYYLEGGNR